MPQAKTARLAHKQKSQLLAPVARGGWRPRTRVGTLMHAPQSPERNATRTCTGSHSTGSGRVRRHVRVAQREGGACSCTPLLVPVVRRRLHTAHVDTHPPSTTRRATYRLLESFLLPAHCAPGGDARLAQVERGQALERRERRQVGDVRAPQVVSFLILRYLIGVGLASIPT